MVDEQVKNDEEITREERTADHQPRPQADGDGSDHGTTQTRTPANEPPDRRQSDR